MYAMLIGVAALWGAATGLLVPRAAYRFSVEPEDAWRDACPAGHALTGPGRGWLGSTRCTTCAEVGAAVAVHTATGSGGARPGPAADTDTDTGADIGTGTDSGADSAAVGPTPYRGGPRYAPSLLVPVVSALGCAAVAATTGARPELAVWLLLAPVAVLLAAIDRRVHRLPDELTLPAAGAAAVLLGIAVLLPEHGGSWLS
ncbi:prepilin peptidase, partial [Streptomyces laculatispora]|nr:prepilin peptidase [Streptomyces laculatispora]